MPDPKLLKPRLFEKPESFPYKIAPILDNPVQEELLRNNFLDECETIFQNRLARGLQHLNNYCELNNLSFTGHTRQELESDLATELQKGKPDESVIKMYQDRIANGPLIEEGSEAYNIRNSYNEAVAFISANWPTSVDTTELAIRESEKNSALQLLASLNT